jgi:hypothetical protein
MKTCTISEAKQSLGRLADKALDGRPTVIVRGGRLLILRAYELPDPDDEFDNLIEEGKESPHRELTPKAFKSIWKRGRAFAKK